MVVAVLFLSNWSKYIAILIVLFFYICASRTKQKGMIYILQWSCSAKDTLDTYVYLEMGQQSFLSRNCTFQNCFITPNRSYFENVLDYDVLLFNIQHLSPNQPINVMSYYNPPEHRSTRQLYILFASEPATLYHISEGYNSIFNFTWTYKFSSDIFYPFFVVKNNIGEVVGPKVDTRWIDVNDMMQTNGTIIQKLRNKHIAAAWVASEHCDRRFHRYLFVTDLSHELYKYGHRIDIYGGCGKLSCPRRPGDRTHLLSNCYDKLESAYYFYLAFENSCSEDYVTEKALHGLQHYTVPIVFGGANYTSTLPVDILVNSNGRPTATKIKLDDNINKYRLIIGPHRYKWNDITNLLKHKNTTMIVNLSTNKKSVHFVPSLSKLHLYGKDPNKRFLPYGSYIDASKLQAGILAKEMNDIMNNKQRYYDFFKWHGYYSFEDVTDSDHRETICGFCEFLNTEILKPDDSVHVYHDIQAWWEDKRVRQSTTAPILYNESKEPDVKQSNNFVSNLFDFLFDNE